MGSKIRVISYTDTAIVAGEKYQYKLQSYAGVWSDYSATITVEAAAAPLTLSSVKANKTSALTGESIKWTAASGGTGPYQYCFYLYRDGTQVKKTAYGASNTFSYSPTEPGSYTDSKT